MNETSTNKTKKVFIVKRVIYYILGILEVLLAFRLVFKLLGANPESGFVSFLYSVTKVFLAPFKAIFEPAASPGIENGVLEPSTLIAMLVYAVVAWGIVKGIMAFRGRNNK